jgi:hypothetical protein
MLMLRRFVAVLAGVLGVGCAVLVLGAGSALAFETHVFSSSFGSAGSGAGQVLLGVESGVAVDAGTHDVYVADPGNARVDEFEANGTFVRAWGWGVADGLPSFETCTLVCQRGIAGSGAGQFTTPVFVAVDNSTGDVYVGDSADNVVSKFTAAGVLVGSWGTGGQLDGSSTGAGSFGSLAGVAVGSGAGTLYVLNASSRMFEFAQDGSFGSEFEVARGTEPDGAAVDAAGDIFKVNGDESVEEITGSNVDVGQVTLNGSSVGGPTSAVGLAVGASGDLYVAEPGGVGHYVFNELGVVSERGTTCTFGSFSGCSPTDSFGSTVVSGGSGIGVDSSSGDVFVADASAGRLDVFVPAVFPDVKTGLASGVEPTSATLNGSVDPDGVQLTDCHFEYGTSTAYGQSVPCVPAAGAIPADLSEHAVSATVTGLVAGTTYHFRLAAANANGPNTGADATFETPPPPSVEGATTANLTATSVDLDAQVNPRGTDTTYRFEYGTSLAYGTSVPVPDADIGAGASDVPVTTHVLGLGANTTYHWRVVAHNASGTTTTGDQTFIYDTSGEGLPDGRAYEMVTPPQKNSALIGYSLGMIPADVSADGSRLILGSVQCFAGAGSCTGARKTIGEPYEFTRTSSGWVTTPLAPSATQFDQNTGELVSVEDGTALFSMPTPPLREDDFYARQPGGSFVDLGPEYLPADGANTDESQEVLTTADISHVVYTLTTRPDLFWPFDATTGSEGSPYEYVGTGNAAPALVGVSGGAGSTDLISVCGTQPGGSGGEYGALSADGGTVFFTAHACSSGSGVNAGVPVAANTLYARIDGSRTVQISGGAVPASFKGASADGSRVFFTEGENLYEYDFSSPAGHNLVTVSAGDTSGGGPRVQGVVAISPDGSHVYFVAQGVLSGAANDQGQVAQSGAYNLYMFERDASYPEGRMAFVAALSGENVGFSGSDSEEWNTVGSGVGDKANVTPDGRFLVFTSHARLTTDDTSATGAAQVFRYDAQAGELVRISIGERGFDDNGNAGVSDARIAEQVVDHAGPPRTDPTMSEDGSFVFFQSSAGLTPRALNDVQIATSENTGEPVYANNVYEWHEGNVYLISDGRDTSLAAAGGSSVVNLVGSDATGANVFFSTADQLVPQDTDTQVDYYDARICTASEPCVAAPAPPAPCAGEGCRGAPEGAPSLLAPGSAGFAGAGNLTPPPPVKPAVKPKKKKAKPRKHAKAKHPQGAHGGKAKHTQRAHGGKASRVGKSSHFERGRR